MANNKINMKFMLIVKWVIVNKSKQTVNITIKLM